MTSKNLKMPVTLSQKIVNKMTTKKNLMGIGCILQMNFCNVSYLVDALYVSSERGGGPKEFQSESLHGVTIGDGDLKNPGGLKQKQHIDLDDSEHHTNKHLNQLKDEENDENTGNTGSNTYAGSNGRAKNFSDHPKVFSKEIFVGGEGGEGKPATKFSTKSSSSLKNSKSQPKTQPAASLNTQPKVLGPNLFATQPNVGSNLFATQPKTIAPDSATKTGSKTGSAGLFNNAADPPSTVTDKSSHPAPSVTRRNFTPEVLASSVKATGSPASHSHEFSGAHSNPPVMTPKFTNNVASDFSRAEGRKLQTNANWFDNSEEYLNNIHKQYFNNDQCEVTTSKTRRLKAPEPVFSPNYFPQPKDLVECVKRSDPNHPDPFLGLGIPGQSQGQSQVMIFDFQQYVQNNNAAAGVPNSEYGRIESGPNEKMRTNPCRMFQVENDKQLNDGGGLILGCRGKVFTNMGEKPASGRDNFQSSPSNQPDAEKYKLQSSYFCEWDTSPDSEDLGSWCKGVQLCASDPIVNVWATAHSYEILDVKTDVNLPSAKWVVDVVQIGLEQILANSELLKNTGSSGHKDCPCIETDQATHMYGGDYVSVFNYNPPDNGLEYEFERNYGSNTCQKWDLDNHYDCVDHPGGPRTGWVETKNNPAADCYKTWCWVNGDNCMGQQMYEGYEEFSMRNGIQDTSFTTTDFGNQQDLQWSVSTCQRDTKAIHVDVSVNGDGMQYTMTPDIFWRRRLAESAVGVDGNSHEQKGLVLTKKKGKDTHGNAPTLTHARDIHNVNKKTIPSKRSLKDKLSNRRNLNYAQIAGMWFASDTPGASHWDQNLDCPLDRSDKELSYCEVVNINAMKVSLTYEMVDDSGNDVTTKFTIDNISDHATSNINGGQPECPCLTEFYDGDHNRPRPAHAGFYDPNDVSATYGLNECKKWDWDELYGADPATKSDFSQFCYVDPKNCSEALFDETRYDWDWNGQTWYKSERTCENSYKATVTTLKPHRPELQGDDALISQVPDQRQVRMRDNVFYWNLTDQPAMLPITDFASLSPISMLTSKFASESKLNLQEKIGNLEEVKFTVKLANNLDWFIQWQKQTPTQITAGYRDNFTQQDAVKIYTNNTGQDATLGMLLNDVETDQKNLGTKTDGNLMYCSIRAVPLGFPALEFYRGEDNMDPANLICHIPAHMGGHNLDPMLTETLGLIGIALTVKKEIDTTNEWGETVKKLVTNEFVLDRFRDTGSLASPPMAPPPSLPPQTPPPTAPPSLPPQTPPPTLPPSSSPQTPPGIPPSQAPMTPPPATPPSQPPVSPLPPTSPPPSTPPGTWRLPLPVQHIQNPNTNPNYTSYGLDIPAFQLSTAPLDVSPHPDTSDFPYFSGWQVGDSTNDKSPWYVETPNLPVVEISVDNLDSSLKPFVLNFDPKFDSGDTDFEISEPSIADMIYSAADLAVVNPEKISHISIEVKGYATVVSTDTTTQPTAVQYNPEGAYTWSATYIPPEVDDSYGPKKRYGYATLRVATRFQPDRTTYADANLTPTFEYYNEYYDYDCFATNLFGSETSRIPSVFTIMKKTAEISSNHNGIHWNTDTQGNHEDTTFSSLFSKKCYVSQQMKNDTNILPEDKKSRCPVDMPSTYLNHVSSLSSNINSFDSLEMNRDSLQIAFTYFFTGGNHFGMNNQNFTRFTFSNIRRGPDANANPPTNLDLSNKLVADVILHMKTDESDFSATKDLYFAYFDPNEYFDPNYVNVQSGSPNSSGKTKEKPCFAPPCDSLCFPEEENQFPFIVSASQSQTQQQDYGTWKLYFSADKFSPQKITIPKPSADKVFPVPANNEPGPDLKQHYPNDWLTYYGFYRDYGDGPRNWGGHFFFHPALIPASDNPWSPEDYDKEVMKLEILDQTGQNNLGLTSRLSPFPLNFFPKYENFAEPGDRNPNLDWTFETEYYSIAELIYALAERVQFSGGNPFPNTPNRILDRLSVEVRGPARDQWARSSQSSNEPPIIKIRMEGMWSWSATYFLPGVDSNAASGSMPERSGDGKLAITNRFQPDRDRYRTPDRLRQYEEYIPDMGFYQVYDDQECYKPETDETIRGNTTLSRANIISPFKVVKMAEKLAYPDRAGASKRGQLETKQDPTYDSIFARGWKRDTPKLSDGWGRCMPDTYYPTWGGRNDWNYDNVTFELEDGDFKNHPCSNPADAATKPEYWTKFPEYNPASPKYDPKTCYELLDLTDPWCDVSVSDDYEDNEEDQHSLDDLKIRRKDLEFVFTYFYEDSDTGNLGPQASSKTSDKFERFTFSNIRRGPTDAPNPNPTPNSNGQTTTTTLDLSNRLVSDLDVQVSTEIFSEKTSPIWPPYELHLSYMDTNDRTDNKEKMCYTSHCTSPAFPRMGSDRTANDCEKCDIDKTFKDICLCDASPCTAEDHPADAVTRCNPHSLYFRNKCECETQNPCCPLANSEFEKLNPSYACDVNSNCQLSRYTDAVRQRFSDKCAAGPLL